MSLMQPVHLAFDCLHIAVVKITCIHSTKRELKERCLVRDQIALVVETGAKIIYNWDEIDQVSLTIRKLKASRA